MSSPVTVDCPTGVWTLVAAEVTSGNIYRKDARPGGYLQTYRMAGEDAPPVGPEEGVQAFDNNDFAWIESTDPIDVYIMAQRVAGKVRVDI